MDVLDGWNNKEGLEDYKKNGIKGKLIKKLIKKSVEYKYYKHKEDYDYYKKVYDNIIIVRTWEKIKKMRKYEKNEKAGLRAPLEYEYYIYLYDCSILLFNIIIQYDY